MITTFEKRAIALVLTVMMCLSIVCSGSMTVYAQEDISEQNTADPPDEGSALDEETPGEVGENQRASSSVVPRTGTAGEMGATGVAATSIYEYSTLEDGTIEITKYKGSEETVIIPGTLDGKTVSSIGSQPFGINSNLKQVEIPATVTALQYYSFSGCTKLEKVVLPNDSQLKTINYMAFANTGLKEIACPSVQQIKDSAFLGCRNLETVVLGDQLVSIGNHAFALTGLRRIDIPDSVTSIGVDAFGNCGKLEEANIGNKVTYIPEWLFSNCNLKTFTIGGTVTKIGASAFSGNRNLSKIDIPKNVTEIEYRAFDNCEALGQISFPDTLEKIGGFALNNTSWYESQDNGVVYAGRVLYSHKGEMAPGTTVQVKDGTLGIAGYAFSGAKNLKSVIIPEGVTNIGERALRGCVNVTLVDVPESVMDIGPSALGYDLNGKKIPDFIIYGTRRSAAQAYADENSFRFLAAGDLLVVPSKQGVKLKIIPEVTDTVYVIGSSRGVTITCTGALKDLVNVLMDGKIVKEKDENTGDVNYTLAEGSTILTFTAKYLDTLSVGKHTVTLQYTYASVDTELRILARGSGGIQNDTTGASGNGSGSANGAQTSGGTRAPKTGDNSAVFLWLLTALFVSVGCMTIERKKRHSV